MTERTFRDPSPARTTSKADKDDPPPLPALPKEYAKSKSQTNLVMRPSSAEPPERKLSPPSKHPETAVSLDRGPGVSPSQIKKPPPRQPRTEVSQDQDRDRERAVNRASVNFSRPMSPQTSPPVSPTYERTTTTSSPQSKEIKKVALLANEEEQVKHEVREPASAPVRKKKKKVVPAMTAGSHLASGGMGGKPMGSAISEEQSHTSTVENRSSQTSGDAQPGPRKKKKKRIVGQSTEPASSTYGYSSDSEASERSTSSDQPRPYNARAAGVLAKQPSIVREDREGEELAERNAKDIAAARPPENVFAQAGKLKLDTDLQEPETSTKNGPAITSKAAALPPKNPALDSLQQQQRRSSLSPARSAHFSMEPTFDTPGSVRHQPPPRSISPAKSAMKRSPSPRIPSPTNLAQNWNQSGFTASEASDTTDAVSEDGLKPRRKKSVKVSFEDDPTVVGEASTPISTTSSPVILSPQIKDHPRPRWFELGRHKQEPNLDESDVIEPVPALPSFGSIRGKADKPEVAHTPSVTSSTSQEDTNAKDATHGLATSNDHAIGGILAETFATKSATPPPHDPNEPLPPEVTTVEGSGYHSDTESSAAGEQDTLADTLAMTEPDTIQNTDSVPTIAIQPATPGLDTPGQTRESWLGMPGRFPSSESLPQGIKAPVTETVVAKNPGAESTVTETAVAETTPSGLGIAEPEPESSTAYHDPNTPVVGQVAESIFQQTKTNDDESDDSGNSIYSDAAEDMSDLEGDGFGSINAILDSPVVAPKTTGGRSISPIAEEPAKLPKPKQARKMKTVPVQQATGAVNSVRPDDSVSRPQPQTVEPTAAAKPKKKSKPISTPVAQQQPPLASNGHVPKRPAKPKPKSQTESRSMRSSMRNSEPLPSLAPPRSAMRSSMREDPPQDRAEKSRPGFTLRSSRPSSTLPSQTPQTRPRASSQLSEQSGVLKKKTPRPVSDGHLLGSSAPVMGTVGGPQTGKPERSQANRGSVPVMPILKRATSDGSNSSSSFKKTRPRKSSDHQYTMRRSMRSSGNERPQSAVVGAGSTKARQPPPITSIRRPFSSSGPSLRTSMRGSHVDTSRATSPPRSFGFRKDSKTKTKESTKPASRFSSRFGDSSDEDEPPRRFGSRFADSSDEEDLGLDLTPVRGIPRKGDEGDSTDLSDSDDKTKVDKKTKPGVLSSPDTGTTLASGTAPPASKGATQGAIASLAAPGKKADGKDKRRSFFGALGRRKDKDKASKIGKSDLDSAARRDTPLERSKQQRAALPRTPPEQPSSPIDGRSPQRQQAAQSLPLESPTSPRSPTGGKLARRAPTRFASDSWPLPESVASVRPDGRPTTSDGAPRMRASMRGRQGPEGLGDEVGVEANGVPVGKGGKKKRFPMLRKAFRLHD